MAAYLSNAWNAIVGAADAPAVDVEVMEQVAERVVRRILAETAPADAPADANAARDPPRPRFTQWARNVWAKTRRIRFAKLCGLVFLCLFVVLGTFVAMSTPGVWPKVWIAIMILATVVNSSIALNITAFFNEATDENAQDNHGDDQAQAVDRGLGDQPAAGGEGVVGNPEPL